MIIYCLDFLVKTEPLENNPILVDISENDKAIDLLLVIGIRHLKADFNLEALFEANNEDIGEHVFSCSLWFFAKNRCFWKSFDFSRKMGVFGNADFSQKVRL